MQPSGVEGAKRRERIGRTRAALAAAGALAAALLSGAPSGPAAAQSAGDPSSLDPVLDEILRGPQTPAPAPSAPPAARPASPSLSASPAPAYPARPNPAPSGPPPKSAIPWLSEALGGGGGAAPERPAAALPSIAPLQPIRPNGETGPVAAPGAVTDPSGAPYPGQTAAPTPPTNSAAATPVAIEVAPLAEIDRSGVGLLSAQEAGLPPAAWRGVFPDQARAALDQMKPGPYRIANQMGLRLLKAALPQPQGGGAGLFRARLDALTRYGAAREAALLARDAGEPLILESEDAALIAAEEPALCEALLKSPEASLTRIYCQIVGEDLAGAGLALDAARALGPSSDPVAAQLLDAMLAGTVAEALDPTLLAAEPTPLRLAILRRLSAPPPANLTRSGPLSLVPAALSMAASPRQRLEAMERLEAAGALETDDLRLAFAAQTSAESGGVWGRVEAYRDAVETDETGFLAAADAALARVEEAGRRPAMARLLAADAAARSLPAEASPEAVGAPELAVPSAPPPAALAVPAMRALLREGGEGGAAAALSRIAEELGPPAVEPDLIERALDHVAAPGEREDADEPWTERWSEDDSEDLKALGRKGDARAAFLSAVIARLDAPPPVLLGERPVGRLQPGGLATPAEEIADGRAGLLLARALAPLAAPQPTDREVLFAVETAQALGWEAEARELAMAAAMAR